MRGSEGVVDELSGFIKNVCCLVGKVAGLARAQTAPRGLQLRPTRAREAAKVIRAGIYARLCTIQNAPLATCPV